MNGIARMVKVRFPAAQVSRAGEAILVTFGDWTTRIVDNRAPSVPIEARELAERAPPKVRLALLAATHRLEIYDSGDVEADEDHYNDGLLLWERLLKIRGAAGLDPVTGEIC